MELKAESVLRLFKAIPINLDLGEKKKRIAGEKLLKATVKRGFIFSPEVINYYSDEDLLDITNVVEAEFGLTPEKLNQTFHKSWGKVKNAPELQLILEQIIHYITTYGFEKLGIFDENSVYIPNEKLEIPEITEDFKLTIIRGYTKEELKEKLLTMLNSGIALKPETIEDVVSICHFVDVTSEEIEAIKNREVKLQLCAYLSIIPENPVEFLRFLVFKITNKTMLIKDRKTIEELKARTYQDIVYYFNGYEEAFGLEKLSQIFFRYKPLFLAMKSQKEVKPVINKLRRLAKDNHKPMPEDYLNSITGRLKKGEVIDTEKLKNELNKANIFRKIRLASALNYRLENHPSIVYKIRNGKAYSKKLEYYLHTGASEILDVVLNSIIKDVKNNVKNMKIYIPKNMTYALPATEKQFTGNYPSGSFISVPKDMLIGIHWEDLEYDRIDLDLSLIDAGKLGWDAGYRNENRTVLFSGDITEAPEPKGASEFFYVSKQEPVSHIVLVNFYNYEKNWEVPFKIVVGEEEVKRLNKNYIVNPNNVISVVKTKIDQTQKVLGLLVGTPEECRFYFSEMYMGKSITSSNTKFIQDAKQYLFDFYTNPISLNNILEKAGAKFVDKKEDCNIDLSPENLERDTIMNLLIKVKKQ